jgi:hypothetical protein
LGGQIEMTLELAVELVMIPWKERTMASYERNLGQFLVSLMEVEEVLWHYQISVCFLSLLWCLFPPQLSVTVCPNQFESILSRTRVGYAVV